LPLIAFTKMEGAGNDFVVLDATRAPFALSREQVRRLADRHFGVGCDQVLVVEKASRPEADFRYRIFNADGGEVEQCGNGARCFVKFVHGKGLTGKREIRVETLGGMIAPRLEEDGEVSVDMGPPRLETPLVQPLELGGTRVELAIAARAAPALPAARECGLHAGGGPALDPPARVRARRGRDAFLRHRRMRRGGVRHRPRTAQIAGARADARRHVDHRLGGRRQCRLDERPGEVGIRRHHRFVEQGRP
jgi:diaminopimelate epimerase